MHWGWAYAWGSPESQSLLDRAVAGPSYAVAGIKVVLAQAWHKHPTCTAKSSNMYDATLPLPPDTILAAWSSDWVIRNLKFSEPFFPVF